METNTATRSTRLFGAVRLGEGEDVASDGEEVRYIVET